MIHVGSLSAAVDEDEARVEDMFFSKKTNPSIHQY